MEDNYIDNIDYRQECIIVSRDICLAEDENYVLDDEDLEILALKTDEEKVAYWLAHFGSCGDDLQSSSASPSPSS